MTEFERYTVWLDLIGIIATIIIIIIAIWGEKIKQIWNSPKLEIMLEEPTFSITNEGVKGWYYRIKVYNKRKSSPALNTRLWLLSVLKKAPDGTWKEERFSGPSQVLWQWPDFSPQYATIGPSENATFSCLLENSNSFDLKMYWYPNNLRRVILPNDPTRLEFKAVSDTSESKSIIIEIAWDGKWAEGFLEIGNHCVVKKINA